MQDMTRKLIAIILVLGMAFPAIAQSPRPLGQAMDAMRGGNWGNAGLLAERDGAVALDVIEWHRLREGRGSYEEVVAFLDRRPDWPGLEWLRRKSEPVVIQQEHQKVLDFFAGVPPQTAAGILSHARALDSVGKTERARAEVIHAWRTMRMGAGEHALFLGAHENLLKDHHVARLDYMLWRGWTSDAKRMTALVPQGWQVLAQARIALRDGADGVNTLIDKVPASLQSNPGLAFDRFDWRARKRLDTAIDLMLERSTSAETLGRPEAWAPRRRTMARDQMRQGNAKRAYAIAAQNHLTEGSDYADLEWLSGYIALRKLNDPENARCIISNALMQPWPRQSQRGAPATGPDAPIRHWATPQARRRHLKTAHNSRHRSTGFWPPKPQARPLISAWPVRKNSARGAVPAFRNPAFSKPGFCCWLRAK